MDLMTEDGAYFLGLFAADGNLTVNKNGSRYVELTSVDRDLLETVKARLGFAQKLSRRPGRGKERDRYRIQIGSRALFESIEALGFTRAKSRRMALPDLPAALRPHFVRGYFDGDGSVLHRSYPRSNRPGEQTVFRTVFTSASQGFLAGLRSLLAGDAGLLGGVVAAQDGYFRLTYGSSDSLRLGRFMYNEASSSPLGLQRKRRVFEDVFVSSGVVV